MAEVTNVNFGPEAYQGKPGPTWGLSQQEPHEVQWGVGKSSAPRNYKPHVDCKAIAWELALLKRPRGQCGCPAEYEPFAFCLIATNMRTGIYEEKHSQRRQSITLLCLVLLRPHLEYCMHFRLTLQKRCGETGDDCVEGYRMVRDL